MIPSFNRDKTRAEACGVNDGLLDWSSIEARRLGVSRGCDEHRCTYKFIPRTAAPTDSR